MTKQISKFLDDLFRSTFNIDYQYKCNNFNDLESNIECDEDKCTLEIPVLGYKKEEIQINFIDNVITIKGDVENKSKFKKSFVSEYKISDKINSENITSKLEDGILYIYFPYKEKQIKTEPKKIEIQ